MARRRCLALLCLAALLTTVAPEAPRKPTAKGAKAGWKGGKNPFGALKDKLKDAGANSLGSKKPNFPLGKGSKVGVGSKSRPAKPPVKPANARRAAGDKKPSFAPFGSFGKAGGKPRTPPRAPAGKGQKTGKPFVKPPVKPRGKAAKPKGSGWNKPAWNKPNWNKPGKPRFPGKMPKALSDGQLQDIHARQEEQFKLMDADQNGAVTTAEVAEMRRKLKERQTEGGNMEQFESTLLKKSEKDGWHKNLDKNSDGHLTLEEYKFQKKQPPPQEL